MPKRAIRKICILMFLFIFTFSFVLPASAITEEEVQKQVDTQGREAVTGNVFIWFLCAVGFLKVSQRMDSLLSSLGISVGHTGGNMLGEAMIAARTIGAATGRHFHGFGGGSGGSSGGGGGSGSGGGTGFLSGGLVGAVGRQVTKSAVNAATGQGGNPLTRMAFNSSLAQGGNFANGIIGAVARGNIARTGSITGSQQPMPRRRIWAIPTGTTPQPFRMSKSAAGASWAPKLLRNIQVGFHSACTQRISICRLTGHIPRRKLWTGRCGISSTRRIAWKRHLT